VNRQFFESPPQFLGEADSCGLAQRRIPRHDRLRPALRRLRYSLNDPISCMLNDSAESRNRCRSWRSYAGRRNKAGTRRIVLIFATVAALNGEDNNQSQPAVQNSVANDQCGDHHKKQRPMPQTRRISRPKMRFPQCRWNSISTTILTATGCPWYIAGLNLYCRTASTAFSSRPMPSGRVTRMF
jgi:hypothetical protein